MRAIEFKVIYCESVFRITNAYFVEIHATKWLIFVSKWAPLISLKKVWKLSYNRRTYWIDIGLKGRIDAKIDNFNLETNRVSNPNLIA